jgi:hypothetical protein
VIAATQRSAAASERARLVRELPDSVEKTPRGLSFAAFALSSLLRRHSALAQATTVAADRLDLPVPVRFDRARTVRGVLRVTESDRLT